jgi:DNA-binding beta-propeller fold protein YncE
VIAIDATSGDLANPISVGAAPQAIVLAPDGRTAYVLGGIDAATTPSTTPVTVTPITTATGIARRTISVGTLPHELVMSPNGKLLYVLDTSAAGDGKATEITPVDTATDSAEMPIKLAAQGVAFAPNSQTAYAVDTLRGVVPIDTATGATGKPIATLPAIPIDVAVTPDGKTVEVLGRPDPGLESGSPEGDDWTLTPVSTRAHTAGKPIMLGANLGASTGTVTIAADSKIAYVLVSRSGHGGSVVLPVNLSSGIVGRTIPVGQNAVMLALTPNGTGVFVLDGGTFAGVGSPHNTHGSLVWIATATETVRRVIPVGFAPLAFAIGPQPSSGVRGAKGSSDVQNLVVTRSVRGELVAAFAAAHGLALPEVGGTDPAPLYFAYDRTTRTSWAVAFFYPAGDDSTRVKDSFQDAGGDGIFSRSGSAGWRFRSGGAPLLCPEEHDIPAAVLNVWQIPTRSPACP